MGDDFPTSQNQAKPVGLAGLPIPAPLSLWPIMICKFLCHEIFCKVGSTFSKLWARIGLSLWRSSKFRDERKKALCSEKLLNFEIVQTSYDVISESTSGVKLGLVGLSRGLGEGQVNPQSCSTKHHVTLTRYPGFSPFSWKLWFQHLI